MNDHRTSLQHLNGHVVDISHKDNDNTMQLQQLLLMDTISAEPCPQSSPQPEQQPLSPDTPISSIPLSSISTFVLLRENGKKLVYHVSLVYNVCNQTIPLSFSTTTKACGTSSPSPPPVRALQPISQRQGPHYPPSAQGEPKTTDTSSVKCAGSSL